MRWLRTRLLGPRSEDGIALITVILVGSVMLALVVTTLSYGVSSERLARHDQDWQASLSAAEAGIDDYVTRMNNNSTYTQWSNSAGRPDTANPAMNGTFVDLPGAANEGTFRYTIDSSRFAVDGTIAITSTGRVRNVNRSVRATLRRRTFLDYLYYTEYETKDPDAYGSGDSLTPAQAQTYCGERHYYDSPAPASACTDIQFGPNDVIRGPLHSNDAMRMAGGSRFQGAVTTSWAGTGNPVRRYIPTSSGSPIFAEAGDPKYAEPITMPPSNSALKSDATSGGCLFTGPTKVVVNANGTMTVTSPLTKSTRCFTGAMGTTARTMSLPANGVLHVQSVPTSSSDPNYWGTTSCPGIAVGGATNRHVLNQPITGDITTYGCRDGDLFIEGTLDGQMTASADNNVIITWDLMYEDGVTGDDLLGLVANGSVFIYHPVDSNGNNLSIPGRTSTRPRFTNAKVDAAILTLNHSFTVQNYRRGAALGDLTIRGSIAQLYRGVVALSGQTGFEKDYIYDSRLAYLAPPRFIDPVKSFWRIVSWEER
jgi:hypothetical protein